MPIDSAYLYIGSCPAVKCGLKASGSIEGIRERISRNVGEMNGAYVLVSEAEISAPSILV